MWKKSIEKYSITLFRFQERSSLIFGEFMFFFIKNPNMLIKQINFFKEKDKTNGDSSINLTAPQFPHQGRRPFCIPLSGNFRVRPVKLPRVTL